MKDAPEVENMRRMIARARLAFLAEALPLCTDDESYGLARTFAAAVGEVSVEEAMAGFRRGLVWDEDE